jgi:hypothetical protein
VLLHAQASEPNATIQLLHTHAHVKREQQRRHKMVLVTRDTSE